MNPIPSRLLDWRAPASVLIIDENELVPNDGLASFDGQLLTGSALRFEDDCLVATRSFDRGREVDADPFDMFVRRDVLGQVYREGASLRTRRGRPFSVHDISEERARPYMGGEPYTGLTLFASASVYHVLSSFNKGELSEYFWIENGSVTEYVGTEASAIEPPRMSIYRWDAGGRISEYVYLDKAHGSYCEVMIREDGALRVLKIDGKSVLDPNAPRHEFDRFGSFTTVRQLDGCRLSDFLSLAGDGIDTDVLDFLATLTLTGRPEMIRCTLDIDASLHAVAQFLATATDEKANLTNARPADPARLEAVTAELKRLRPDLCIESR